MHGTQAQIVEKLAIYIVGEDMDCEAVEIAILRFLLTNDLRFCNSPNKTNG